MSGHPGSKVWQDDVDLPTLNIVEVLGMKFAKLAVIIATASAFSSACADDRDQLIPGKEAAKVSVKWVADSGAIRAKVTNESNLAITGGKLACELVDPSKPMPKLTSSGTEWCVSPHKLDDYLAQQLRIGSQKCEHADPYDFDINEKVLPGKTKELYFEVPRGRRAPVICKLESMRGRAKRIWDF